MGRIRILEDGRVRELPLAAGTQLGRTWGCTWRVEDTELPALWMELRWFGSGWAWKPLGGDAVQGRGGSERLPSGWRWFAAGSSLRAGSVQVDLIEGGPPESFAVDLDTSERLEGAAAEALLERRADGWWPVDAEQSGRRTRPLQAGETEVVLGRRLVFHLADPPVATASMLDLFHHRTELRLESGRTLQILGSGGRVDLGGSHLQLLVPYFRARLDDDEGWLHVDELRVAWEDLTGALPAPNLASSYRHRIVRALGSEGVRGAERLFDVQGRVSRLQVEARRLTLV